jgi:hypothetical protein
MKGTLGAAIAIGFLAVASAAGAEPDWGKVGQALGKAGQMQPGGVYKVSLPRTDLHVTLDAVPLKAGFALGSWVAFEPMGDEAMAMGDLVLTQAEVNPVMSRLESEGFEITGLHNHLLRSTPLTMYMHFEGHGDPVKLAAALHRALALSRTPFVQSAPPTPGAADFDVATIDRAMGSKGKLNGAVLQYGLPRKDSIHDGGMDVPPAMGTATSINFQGAGPGKVAATGDFVLIATEVNPVIKTLREHGIEVTAIHNHMLNDQPRLFFLHFWGHGSAKAVADGLSAAVKQTNTK